MTAALIEGRPSALDLVPATRSEKPVTWLADWVGGTKSVDALGRPLGGLSAGARRAVVLEVARACGTLLTRMDLGGILADGWASVDQLRAAARATLDAPGSSEVVDLVTCRVRWDDRPSVD